MAKLGERLRGAKPAALPVAAAAAAFLLAIGIGYGIGATGAGGSVATARWMDATAGDIRHANGEIAKLATEARALKASLDGLSGDREIAKAEILARQAQLADKVEKAAQEQATRVARLAERIERLEKGPHDSSRLQGMSERLDRVEKSLAVASVPAAAMPAPSFPPRQAALKEAAGSDVAQTGAIGDKGAKPEMDPRRTQIEGYYVRDFDSGFALVETRAGRYIEVAVGSTVPGVGRVEAIERRGRQWVVVTPKGYIAER